MSVNSELGRFADWLTATPLSSALASSTLAVPSLQTIHIVGVCIIMSSALFFNLRVLGAFGGTQSTGAVAHRYLPWLWWTLPVMLLTGAALTTIEPHRELDSAAFRIKMILVVIVVVLTTILHSPLRQDGAYWSETAGRRNGSRLMAATALALWVCILFAGRLIAYVSGN